MRKIAAMKMKKGSKKNTLPSRRLRNKKTVDETQSPVYLLLSSTASSVTAAVSKVAQTTGRYIASNTMILFSTLMSFIFQVAPFIASMSVGEEKKEKRKATKKKTKKQDNFGDRLGKSESLFVPSFAASKEGFKKEKVMKKENKDNFGNNADVSDPLKLHRFDKTKNVGNFHGLVSKKLQSESTNCASSQTAEYEKPCKRKSIEKEPATKDVGTYVCESDLESLPPPRTCDPTSGKCAVVPAEPAIRSEAFYRWQFIYLKGNPRKLFFTTDAQTDDGQIYSSPVECSCPLRKALALPAFSRHRDFRVSSQTVSVWMPHVAVLAELRRLAKLLWAMENGLKYKIVERDYDFVPPRVTKINYFYVQHGCRNYTREMWA